MKYAYIIISNILFLLVTLMAFKVIERPPLDEGVGMVLILIIAILYSIGAKIEEVLKILKKENK